MDQDLIDHWRTAPDDLFGALLTHSDALALTLDPNGRIERASAAFAALIGGGAEDLAGQPLAALLDGPARTTFTEEILPTLRADGRIGWVDLDLVQPDDGTIPVHVSAYCQLAPNGAVRRIVALCTDGRDRRDALEALHRKALEAQEASEAKSRFLAAMSHEIRTPMNAIMGFAQLLDLSDLDDTHRSHVRAILSAGDALTNLLTDLLDLSQVEAGHLKIETRPFDLHALMHEVAGWWTPSAADKGLTLSVDIDPALPQRIVSDPLRIQQVLNNYLGNAVKFTTSGTVALHVENRAGPSAPPLVRFRVSDTGPGIAPEDVARLYKPFVQLDQETTRDRGGWGLGLSICANIAEMMGADVGVDTRLGEGSVFWFDLPVQTDAAVDASETAEPAEAGPEAHDTPPAARRILLAEDDRLNQDVMCRMLRDMGHEVVAVANGFEALEALGRESFDIVVMDVMMPGLDGVGATRRLRASDLAQREIPIIGCSAHVTHDAEARYRAVGMSAFLPKPVERARLRTLIDQVTRA